MSRKWIIFLLVALVVIALDQATKIWIFTQLGPHEEIQVIPGLFSIVHAQNPGAAGGILRDFEYRIWVFLGFTLVAIGIIINMQRQITDNLRFIPTILALILGGALGNGIDRVHKGTVTDFLRVYTDYEPFEARLVDWFGTAEYPSFNIADSALVVGVGLFVIHYLFLDDGELDGKPEGGEADAPPADASAGTPGETSAGSEAGEPLGGDADEERPTDPGAAIEAVEAPKPAS